MGYWNALAAAMTAVNGNGGGTRQATISGAAAFWLIFFLQVVDAFAAHYFLEAFLAASATRQIQQQDSSCRP